MSMEYVVIRSFTDKATQQHYVVGDRYPHHGFAKKERVEELSTVNNRRGVILIEAKTNKVEKPVKKAKTETETKEITEEVVETPVEVEEKPKRGRKKK